MTIPEDQATAASHGLERCGRTPHTYIFGRWRKAVRRSRRAVAVRVRIRGSGRACRKALPARPQDRRDRLVIGPSVDGLSNLPDDLEINLVHESGQSAVGSATAMLAGATSIKPVSELIPSAILALVTGAAGIRPLKNSSSLQSAFGKPLQSFPRYKPQPRLGSR